jgi:hypothetical protein
MRICLAASLGALVPPTRRLRLLPKGAGLPRLEHASIRRRTSVDMHTPFRQLDLVPYELSKKSH